MSGGRWVSRKDTTLAVSAASSGGGNCSMRAEGNYRVLTDSGNRFLDKYGRLS
jgi:hypothetical protein